MAKAKKEMDTKDEVIQKFMDIPVAAPAEKEPETPKDTVILTNKRKLKINPTKLKYFKTGDYNIYHIIDELGVSKVLGYSDGFDLISKFLSAVFDKPYKTEEVKGEDGEYTTVTTYDEYITTLIDDELNINDLTAIINASLAVNGIEKENF